MKFNLNNKGFSILALPDDRHDVLRIIMAFHFMMVDSDKSSSHRRGRNNRERTRSK